MKPRKVEVDFIGIWEALNKVRAERNMTWDAVGKILEIEPQQFSSLRWQGRGLNAHSVLAIMHFLEADFRDFTKRKFSG